MPNAVIGQSGLEYEYDSYLRAGDTLHLSISSALQRAGQHSLAHAIATNPGASGGAFVAMNPENGQILAMGSNPTFDPTDFTHPMTEAYYKSKYGPNSGDPQFNRAIASAGPVGSVFTPLTAIAALQSGAWRVDQSYDDTGQFCFPNTTLCLRNSGNAAYGVVNVTDAIRTSDDGLFYDLEVRLNADPVTHPNGGALQRWARAFGIGQATGVDLPGEASGALPSPSYLRLLAKEETQCENATGPYKGHPRHPASQGGCGISNAQSADWTVGDNVNTAVGQGDVQVTPLQLAVAYAALANGGTVVTPHVGASVTAAGGATRHDDRPARRRDTSGSTHARWPPSAPGCARPCRHPGGAARDVFGSFPEQVYGRTGTAQHNGQQDYAWFAGYVPASATRHAVVVVRDDRAGRLRRGRGRARRAPDPVAVVLRQARPVHPGDVNHAVAQRRACAAPFTP